MKQGTRLYINITNKCNVACPFCCMFSSPSKNTFMDFETYKNIIDTCDDTFELQLEGGEPLLHKNIFLFLEYAVSTNRCTKVIILTNGLIVSESNDMLKRFVDFSVFHDIRLEFKISINNYLAKVYAKNNGDDENIYKAMGTFAFAVKYIDSVAIKFNVRCTHENKSDIERMLEKYQLTNQSNVFYLQSYGKMKDDDSYEKPIIVQNISNWRIYSADGTCFGQDLIARSEHENLTD